MPILRVPASRRRRFRSTTSFPACERTPESPISSFSVDGGACRNDFLLQRCSDIVGLPIERPACVESTALGAAYLAGLSAGVWKDLEEIRSLREVEGAFDPVLDCDERRRLLEYWRECVARTRSDALARS